MTSPAVELIDVWVNYGSTVALRDLNLALEPGHILSVIGPSGSGKSTLVRAIAGLEPLSRGTILLDGEDTRNVPTHKRDIGLMFQSHALFPHLNVADNIAFGLRMAGQAKPERARRVDELLEMVELTELAHRSIDQLSGGEAQRVALARALAPSPKVLMLDEPFGSLDRVLREQLVAEVGGLLRTMGQTAIHVTHDQPEAFAVADTVLMLSEGAVAQLDEPAELWRNPVSTEVARFVGHPNIWPVDGGDRYLVVPVTALSVDPAGDLVATVAGSKFAEGTWRHVAISPSGPVEFDHPTRLSGQVRLAVDVGQTRELKH